MKRCAFISLVAFLLVTPLSAAQTTAELRLLARDAGLIFSGTVESVERVAPQHRGDIGVIQITFRADDGFRGVASGELLTIREWDGLWAAGDRYRVGESLVVFFYAPSGELGLTTTVGGNRGRIPRAELPMTSAEIARAIATPELTGDHGLSSPKRDRRKPPRHDGARHRQAE